MNKYDFKSPTYWEMLRHSGWALVITTFVPLILASVGTILIGREFSKLQNELNTLKKICPANAPLVP